MILTPRMIADMRRYCKVDEHLEALLLERFGSEPYPHEYTEHDLYEQTRKIIAQYNEAQTSASKNSLEPEVARPIESEKEQGGNCTDQRT